MAIHPVLGEYPGDGKVGRVVQNAQPGGVYDVPIQYIEGASLELKATELPQSGSGTVRIESVFEVESERQWCENEDTKGWNMGTKYPYDTEGQSITSFICDSDNFEKYLEGKDFDVFELLERSPEGNLVFESDRQRDWYVVITNELSYGVTKEINVSISMFYSGRPVVDITDPVIGSLHAGDVDITVNGRVFCTESIASLEYRVDSDQWIDILFSYDEATGSFSFSWDPGVLSTGEHTLDFRAEDTNSEQGSRQLTIVIDASPPELGLTEPLNRTVYDLGDEVALSGTVDDDLGNVLLFLEVHSEEKRSGDIIISENISHLVSQGSFEYSIETDDLDAGEYNAVISAFDDVGHVTISRISFFIDEEGPQIIITSHGNGDLVGGRDLILITGTAVDDVGFSTLEMEISDLGSNDILPRLNGTGWDYEWNVSDLESDIYQIVVTGYDGVDRWSQASMTLELDADAPELEILNENGSVVSDDKIVEIIGTAYDDNDVETLEIAVIPATEEHDPATVVMKEPDLAWESLMKKYSRSEWKYEWDTTGLEAGDHLIIVRAIDQVGNTRLSAMNMKIDNEVPVITMEMDHDVETEPLVTGMVEFKGTALDNDLVETLELTWNRGKTWTSLLSEYDGMNWTYHWDVDTLESGEYRIEIRAVDRAGKQFVLKSDFTVDNDDPELKINSRTVSEYTVGDSVVFSGTVYDEYGLDSMVFRIDQGDWRSTVLDNDTGKWHFQWSTEDEAPGRHTITLLVRDKVGHDTSDTLTLTLKEREKEGTGGSVLGSESWYPWILISAAVLVVLGVALILIIMKRKRKKERDDELPTLTADENGDVLHIPLQGFTPTEIQSLEKGPERNDPGTNYSKNYYEARGHESTGIGDREQVPAELGSAAGPDCMKCGRPSKYYTEHDCYWCEGCRDYVRREEPVESSQEDNELESLAPPDKLPVTTVNVKKEQRLMLPAAKVDEETRAGTMEDDMTSARRDRPSGTASDKIQPEITDSNTGNPKMEMNALKSDVGEGGQLAVRTVKPRRVVKRRKTIKN